MEQLICYNAHTCCMGVCRALMDRLQRKQGDIVADPLKVTAITVCQVWHQLTQQGNKAYAMYRKLNQHHSARSPDYWFGSEITVTAQEEQITLFILISKWSQFFVHQCGSASAFFTHFSRWTSHNGAFISFFSLYPSSRCQVQWESSCRWMPSDTFQNNDNKQQAGPQAVHLRSSLCKLTTACTEGKANAKATKMSWIIKHPQPLLMHETASSVFVLLCRELLTGVHCIRETKTARS